MPSNFYGGAAISTRLGKRASFQGSANFGYSPFYSFSTFITPASMDEVRVPSNDQNIARLDTYTSGGSSTLWWLLSRRSSIYGGYTLDYVTTPNAAAYQTLTQGTTAGFQRQLSRYLSLRLGHRFSRSEQYSLSVPHFDTHTIDTGVGYSRPISSSRRSMVGFSVGPAMINQGGLRSYTVTGDGSLSYQLNRTWTTVVFYQRNVERIGGLLTPYVYDAFSGSLAGLWTRRFGFTGSGSYTRGRSAFIARNTYDSDLCQRAVPLRFDSEPARLRRIRSTTRTSSARPSGLRSAFRTRDTAFAAGLAIPSRWSAGGSNVHEARTPLDTGHDPVDSQETKRCLKAGLWPTASGSLCLRPGHVHVWSVWLDPSEARVGELGATLSADELERASRLRFDRHRRRFVCARGALREILGAYLGVDARALKFTYGAHGKPALGVDGARRVSFNVSHSEDVALIAVAPEEIEIGVDVESLRSMSNDDDIARRFFAPSEVARLQSLPAGLRERAFFECWTRKEAYLKATGDGLARPLDAFEVTFGPGERAELRVLGDQTESARWTLVSLEPVSGFAGALVVTEPLQGVECWDWTGPAVRSSSPPACLRVAV